MFNEKKGYTFHHMFFLFFLSSTFLICNMLSAIKLEMPDY